MEFNEKLRQLRTASGLTQEELAEKLFVSRVTVSKWESGRGYPNIESLKLLAKVMSVSIDDLLSGKEVLAIAERQAQESSKDLSSLVFGLIDLMIALLFVLPLFGQAQGDRIVSVALPSLTDLPPDILWVSYALVITISLFGVVELGLQNYRNHLWLRIKLPLSVGLSVLSVLFFIMTRHPYVSAYLLCLLLLKGYLLIKTGMLRKVSKE